MKMSLHKRKMSNLVEYSIFKIVLFSLVVLIFVLAFEANTSLFGFNLVTFNVLEKIENSWSEA